MEFAYFIMSCNHGVSYIFVLNVASPSVLLNTNTSTMRTLFLDTTYSYTTWKDIGYSENIF